jgi:hypothetical protein
MNINNKILFVALLIFSVMFSCNDAAKKVNKNDKKLSTDLVKNNQSLKMIVKKLFSQLLKFLSQNMILV